MTVIKFIKTESKSSLIIKLDKNGSSSNYAIEDYIILLSRSLFTGDRFLIIPIKMGERISMLLKNLYQLSILNVFFS